MSNSKLCPTCGTSYSAENAFCPLDSAPLRSIVDGDKLIGSVVAGRYLVSDRIGAGGMGVVYRAQDVRLQRPAAIKVLHASLNQDPDALARFSREASNASKINNEHVVHVYDFGETEDGVPYLAMEFVSGESLRTVLEREGPLAPERAAKLLGQVALGLEAAHRLEEPVVHRDLKPDNILVTVDRSGHELAKVVDFGISKALRNDAQRVTKTGFVTGTYEFMSPEQVTGGEVDQKSDVYALGLVAFLMLTGKLPFPGATPEHAMLMRLTEAPRPLRAMHPGVRWPEGVQRVLDRALARDPAMRFDSAEEFAAQLHGEIESWQSPPRPKRRQRRALVWAGAAGVAALVAAGVVALWPRPEVTAQAGERIPVGSTPLGLRESGITPSEEDQPPATERATDGQDQSDRPRPTNEDTAKPSAEMVPSLPPRPLSDSARPRPRPVQPPRRAPSPSTAGNAELESYADILHPEMPRDSALLALRGLEALMPHLSTRKDSVDADIYRAEAYALAGQAERACAILDAARPRATARQRKKIEFWTDSFWADQGICPPPAWRAS
jgi:serine/threonine protein kinase